MEETHFGYEDGENPQHTRAERWDKEHNDDINCINDSIFEYNLGNIDQVTEEVIKEYQREETEETNEGLQ